MRPRPRSLPSYEIPIRSGSTSFAGRHFIRIHRKAHRTAGLAPLESGGDEDAVEPLGLGLALDQAAPRHDQRTHAVSDMPAVRDGGGGAQILDPRIGAAADKDM